MLLSFKEKLISFLFSKELPAERIVIVDQAGSAVRVRVAMVATMRPQDAGLVYEVSEDDRTWNSTWKEKHDSFVVNEDCLPFQVLYHVAHLRVAR